MVSTFARRTIAVISVACLAVAGYLLFPSLYQWLSSQGDETKNVNAAMDMNEASIHVPNEIYLNWYEVVCPERTTMLDEKDVQDTITRSNAILVRSNSTFKMKLGKRKTIAMDDCSLALVDQVKTANITAIVKNLNEGTNATASAVIVSVYNDPSMYTRTLGFSITGSRISFVDYARITQPANTLMHELGHAWNLPHPFNSVGVPYGDLPPACADSSTRVVELENCPQSLRTCPGATRDEALDNVMDYLPERCGRKFYFSPYQMAVLEKNALNKDYIIPDSSPV
jgi:ribosomal protein S24E